MGKAQRGRLLHPISGGKGLFFPFSTCTRYSELCRKYCYQRKLEKPSNYQKGESLYAFFNKTTEEIVDILVKELNGEPLHWFVSGDCISAWTKIIADVVYNLHKKGVIQCGFTRNRELWLLMPDIFIYSVDSYWETQEEHRSMYYKCELTFRNFENFAEYWLDHHDYLWERNLMFDYDDKVRTKAMYRIVEKLNQHNYRIAQPDLKTEGVEIYRIIYTGDKTIKIKHVGGCGGSSWVDKYLYPEGKFSRIKSDVTCSACLKKKIGCFARDRFEIEKPPKSQKRMSVLDIKDAEIKEEFKEFLYNRAASD